jgi:hypothetical protein
MNGPERIAEINAQHDGIVLCNWFALCTNDATTTEPHPILGDVPICARCATIVREQGGRSCPTCGETLHYYTLGAPGIGRGYSCDNGHDFPIGTHRISTLEDER